MATSVKAILARIREYVKTALGNTRAPVQKTTKAKTVNYVSSSSWYTFKPELPEESKVGKREKLKCPRKESHITSNLNSVLHYNVPL